MESGRWHASHFAWKIGAMSFVNVGAVSSAAFAMTGAITTTPTASRRVPRHFRVALFIA
jgi:hypothetical protein